MIDLHVHTTASDGTLTPTEIIILAKESGLLGIGITDHDTVAGIAEAIASGKEKGIQVIPGIELSCNWNDQEIHILGYFISYKSKDLIDKLKFLQDKRQHRIYQMVDEANKHGYKVTIDEVKALASGESIGRPHLAQALLKKGYISSVAEGFEKYLTKGKPFYVPRYKLTPFEAIDIISNVNGVSVLAHPGLYKDGWENLLPDLIAVGLAGIEINYPEHSDYLIKELQILAKKNNLIATGGSDFHGNEIRENMLGTVGVRSETVKLLKERKKLI
ncbi:MAG: PHP domain-containing protein [Clostridia bacterium]|jgi:predicted metal-dependent phosphoesterase TrpH|nr:PHP domain-containing protein [Clostridia bacterium]